MIGFFGNSKKSTQIAFLAIELNEDKNKNGINLTQEKNKDKNRNAFDKKY